MPLFTPTVARIGYLLEKRIFRTVSKNTGIAESSLRKMRIGVRTPTVLQRERIYRYYHKESYARLRAAAAPVHTAARFAGGRVITVKTATMRMRKVWYDITYMGSVNEAGRMEWAEKAFDINKIYEDKSTAIFDTLRKSKKTLEEMEKYPLAETMFV